MIFRAFLDNVLRNDLVLNFMFDLVDYGGASFSNSIDLFQSISFLWH